MKRGARRRVRVKSVHQCAELEDGMRVWVERVLPRSPSRAEIDLWLRDAAPSRALERWYGLDPRRWDAFRERYLDELGRPPRLVLVRLLEDLRRRTTVTLVFGAQDGTRTHAAVLREFIDRKGELP